MKKAQIKTFASLNSSPCEKSIFKYLTEKSIIKIYSVFFLAKMKCNILNKVCFDNTASSTMKTFLSPAMYLCGVQYFNNYCVFGRVTFLYYLDFELKTPQLTIVTARVGFT